MPDFDVVRAWKDPRYRRTLGARERARLPRHPAGEPPGDGELGAGDDGAAGQGDGRPPGGARGPGAAERG